MSKARIRSTAGWAAALTREQQLACAYGAIMLASSALNSVFVTFYLNVFMHVSSVTPGWFYAGQTIFAFWNAVNDPLFGWMSDTASGRTGASRRLRNIAVGGPLWAIGFALVWLPWSTSDVSPLLSGLHFAVSLCLYDGALTFVEVNHSALLSDMTHDGPTRAKANAASGIGAAIGAIASYIAQVAWASGSFYSFQVVCLAVAAVAAAAIALSVSHLNTLLAPQQQQQARTAQNPHAVGGETPPPYTSTVAPLDTDESPTALPIARGRPRPPRAASFESRGAEDTRQTPATHRNAPEEKHSVSISWLPHTAEQLLGFCLPSLRRYGHFVRQLTRHRSFLVFVVVSTIQVFDCTFEKNFFGMFLDVLTADGGGSEPYNGGGDSDAAGDSITHSANAAVLTLSFVLPHVVTVLLAPLTQRIGVAAVLDRIFGARLVVLCAAWAMGPVSPLLSGTTVLLNRVMSESVCRSFPLVTADIVDEDTVRNGRQDSLGASVIGTAALVSKLSQSIAPMIGYSLMASISHGGVGAAGGGGVTGEDQLFVWDVLVFLPAACVLVQLLAWRTYPLRAEYMAEVKTQLQSRDLAPGTLDATAAASARSPLPDRDVSTPAAPPV